MQCVMSYMENIEHSLEDLEMIRNQKIVSKIPLADELKAINQLNIERFDDKALKEEIEKMFKEFKSDYLPKLVMKSEGIF
jgi:hypothetical protein